MGREEELQVRDGGRGGYIQNFFPECGDFKKSYGYECNLNTVREAHPLFIQNYRFFSLNPPIQLKSADPIAFARFR